MKADDSGSLKASSTVTDPAQAAILSDPERRRYFAPFLARECTASRAAVEVDCTLNAMLYRIGTFKAAGLLNVTRLTKRPGRPIKHYRSSHDAYFLPFESTPYTGLEERLLEQMKPFWREIAGGMAQVLRESGWDGQRVFRHESGEVWAVSGEMAPGKPDNFTHRMGTSKSLHLRLSDETARALLTELERLFEHYANVKAECGRTYVLDLSLVPTKTNSSRVPR